MDFLVLIVLFSVHQEDRIRDELSNLWKSSSFDSMTKCRNMFIRLAVDLTATKWTCNALANGLQAASKSEVQSLFKIAIFKDSIEGFKITFLLV